MKCKHCNCTTYFIKSIKPGTNEYYLKETICRKCDKTTQHKINLILSEKKYHIFTYKSRTQTLHRWIWELYNNRMLMKNEIVHHINGDIGDNRPTNLLVIEKKKHNKNLQYEYLINKINELEKENKWLKSKLKE